MKQVGVWLTWLLMTIFGVTPATSPQVPQVPTPTDQAEAIAIVAQNLDTPWEIGFLANGDLLVTERPGRLLRIGQNQTVYQIEGVKETSEGGLLGLAVKEPHVYLYLTTTRDVNQVVRYKLQDDKLQEATTIVDNIPAGANHDGGRIAFGPDGYLYITTGETYRENLAQVKTSLAGKILRVKEDGSGLEMYSYGHRNPQGLAWDDQGNLWSTEHGRSGIQSGYDELNLITRGVNYGWPQIEGDQTRSGMERPVIHSGPNITWAPSGLAYLEGSLFFAGLRGETLYEYKMSQKKLVEHFPGRYGRLRAVVVGPDGFLYISTSNRDGRGKPEAGDDQILKIDPRSLLTNE